jgi:hypothetical protein
MPTGDHFIHRFYDNYLEAAQGVVCGARCCPWKERTKYETGVGGTTSAKQNYSSHRHAALFFNTQIATSLSACRGAWWTH